MTKASAPSARFLPGAISIRGGAARHFASDWHFHRGIHLESTSAIFKYKIILLQILTVNRSTLKVDS